MGLLAVLAAGIAAACFTQVAAEWRMRLGARSRMMGELPPNSARENLRLAAGDLARRLENLFPARALAWYGSQLRRARWESTSPGQLLGLQLLSGAGSLVLLLALPGAGVWSCFFALIATLLPLLALRDAAARRQASMEKSLPDALDLLTTCVEAGLSFDLSLHRVTARLGVGPLRQELEFCLSKMKLGQTRREALRELARESGLPDLRSLVAALVQADQMGAPLGPALRSQAFHLRSLRGQRVQKAAALAPVKLLFPLMAFILPVVFLVLFGPLYIKWSQGGF